METENPPRQSSRDIRCLADWTVSNAVANEDSGFRFRRVAGQNILARYDR